MIDRQKPPPQPAASLKGCLLYFVTMLGLVIVFIIAGKTTYDLLQHFVIDLLYGTDAYTHGVHLVGRHGQLSDGRQMPRLWYVALCIGSFLISMLPVLVYAAILRAFDLFPPERLFEKFAAENRITSAAPPRPPWLTRRRSSLKRRHSGEPKEDWKKTWKC